METPIDAMQTPITAIQTPITAEAAPMASKAMEINHTRCTGDTGVARDSILGMIGAARSLMNGDWIWTMTSRPPSRFEFSAIFSISKMLMAVFAVFQLEMTNQCVTLPLSCVDFVETDASSHSWDS
jgi:hypothetical protein